MNNDCIIDIPFNMKTSIIGRQQQKQKEKSTFNDFNFTFYWDMDRDDGDPSLGAAITFFTEAEPSRFAKLPFETLWKIFIMKQNLEIADILNHLKSSTTVKIGRLEINRFECRFRLTGISYHPRERKLPSRDKKGIQKLLRQYRDIMHLERTTCLV